MKRQQMLRKQGKKGFTLVELIVVIVILGILAAIAVPALVGYIDKARTDGAITEAATARTALQVILSDAYGNPAPGSTTDYIVVVDNVDYKLAKSAAGAITWTGDLEDAINFLTGYSDTAGYSDLGSVTVSDNWQLTGFELTVPTGPTVTLNIDGTWEVDPA